MTRPTNPLQRISKDSSYQERTRIPVESYAQAKDVEVAWPDQAACRGRSHEMFPRYHKDISYISTARSICRMCPVKADCLDYALQWPITDMHGVWAGLTPRQLAAEQQKRGIKVTRPTVAQIWAEFARLERMKKSGDG